MTFDEAFDAGLCDDCELDPTSCINCDKCLYDGEEL